MTVNQFSYPEATSAKAEATDRQGQSANSTSTPTNNLMVMDTLKAILVGLGIPEDTIGEDTLIHAHLGLDSVETVKLSLELKRELDLDLKLGTRQDLTLAEICQMVVAPLPARSA